MRPLLPSLTVLLSTAGAASCTTQPIHDRAEARHEQLFAEATLATAYTTCPRGKPLDRNCGLIARVVSTERFRDGFREAYCQERSAEECQERYQRMITAQLELRYFGANFEAVARTCDANPSRCHEPEGYERELVSSHNATVARWASDEYARIEAQRREELRAHGERTARIVGEAIFFAHRGPKCRSYPSVFEGHTNTVCSD